MFKMNFKALLAVIAVLVVIAGAVLFFGQQQSQPLQPVLGDVHIHADFKVYINGEQHSFSQAKYMSSKNATLSSFVHLHDLGGEVIHVHIAGVTLGEFFNSLEMKLNSTCFALDSNESFCNNGEKALKLYVNGVENNAFENYELDDLDKILITYGNESEPQIAQQLNSVTDKACIQSGKCPDRGLPSDESSCLTGSDCVA